MEVPGLCVSHSCGGSLGDRSSGLMQQNSGTLRKPETAVITASVRNPDVQEYMYRKETCLKGSGGIATHIQTF